MRILRLLIPLLMFVGMMAHGQATVDYLYWFDNATQPQGIVYRTSSTWQTDIDVSQLSEGLHWIYFLVQHDSCQSQPVCRPFVKLAASAVTPLQAIFSVDGQVLHTQEMASTGGVLNYDLDVSSLSPGMHRFAVIAYVPGNGMSEQHEAFFYHAGDAGCHAAQCVWAVDGGEVHHQAQNLGNGTFRFDANVSSLTDGLHEMMIVLLDEEGNLLDHRSQFFYKGSNAGVQSAQCVWAVDGGEVHHQAQNLGNGTFSFNANVASIPDGLHEIKIMLLDEGSNLLDHRSCYFVKRTNETTAIARYNVWVNDNVDQASNVEINPAQDPYSLVALLPVGHEPFRTSNFHFEFDNQNQPKLYARNEVHVRFHDVEGRMTAIDAPFIDYTISRDVTDVSLLVSGESQTHPYPAEGTIKWFKFDAGKGDSLSFKTDRACSIQLFSPSGKELYNASGVDAVDWGGASGDTDGTYYVALHDVTAAQGSDVTIDYLHIDRYAILGQDVNRVGNAFYSTITFEGNGFNELNDVELVCGSDTIQAIHIGHEHNGTTTVSFYFEEATLGNYNAIFTFEEGSITLNNCITIETAVESDIEITAQYSSSYLLGTSTPVKFMVHNKGNTTAYNVPLEIYMFAKDSVSLNKVVIEGYDVLADVMTELGDDFTSDIEEQIQWKRVEKGDLYAFWKFRNTTYIQDYPFMYWTDFYFHIPPNTTETFVINVKSQRSNHVMMGVANEDSIQINSSKILMKEEPRKIIDVDALKEWFVLTVTPKKSPREQCLADLQAAVNPGQTGHNSAWDVFKEEYPNYNQDMEDCNKLPDKPTFAQIFPFVPKDPNDIYGYLAESGSHAIGGGVNEVNYRIEFENDTAFATASAQNIWVTDTLDATRFDLNSFAPMSIKIGNRTEVLDGSPSFIRTIDMRPEIYAIAQVECNYDAATGIAQWHLSSIDPMTMEPVTEVNQGILPVNYDGVSGTGEVSFNIGMRDNLSEGTTLSNRAGIIFDYNEVIMTPSWANVLDLTPPTSHATGCELVNDSTAAVTMEGSDNLSGPWRYDVMVQYGAGSEWFVAARGVPADSVAQVRVYEGIDHGFCIVLTDSAGNVENKALEPEITFDYFESTTDSELTLSLAQNWNWMSHNLNVPLEVTVLQPNAYRIVGQNGETIKDPIYGYTGTINELDPTKLYKVQMNNATSVPLSGKLYNAAFKSTDLVTGWNWLGYPLAVALAPDVALANLEAQDGDCIIGQDGMAMYGDGHWSGTLTQLQPGKGYMLQMQSNAMLRWNVPRVSTRKHAAGAKHNGDAAPYMVDAHLYPNVMGVVADLYDGGSPVDVDDYWLVAFCGNECRGVAQTVDGHLMMNVYGNSGETITFKAIDRTTQKTEDVAESRVFAQSVEGTLQMPLQLNIGTTGLNDLSVKGLRVYPTLTKGDVNISTTYGELEQVDVLNANGQTMMSLQNMGSSTVISLSDMPDGIYMIRVTTAAGTSTTKVVKQ